MDRRYFRELVSIYCNKLYSGDTKSHLFSASLFRKYFVSVFIVSIQSKIVKKNPFSDFFYHFWVTRQAFFKRK